MVDQLAQLEHEEPGPLPVGEQDAEPLVVVDDAFELGDAGARVHDELTGDPGRQGVDLLVTSDEGTFVVEVNGIPGWQALQSVCEQDLTDRVATMCEALLAA